MSFIYSMADSWAASGTVLTSIGMSVADTGHAAGSKLVRLTVNTVDVFTVDPDGTAYSKTQPYGDNSLKLATTAFVQAQMSALSGTGGATLIGTADGGTVQTALDARQYASTAEAQAGTATTKMTSPARVKDAMEGLAFADPYGLSQTNTLNNRFQRVYDMKAAGCPNNGTDDDYPTFLALYNQAKAAGAGCILLPDGPLRFNTTPVISDPCISVIGSGAGATRWHNASRTNNFLTLKGADVHSIEIGHIQFETLSGLTQTGGAVFSFERAGGVSGGAGCFDVKLHHFTTFNAFHGISTGYSAQGPSTAFLDIMAQQFVMRDMVGMGINITQSAGFKMDQYTIGFPDPQGTRPAAGSACIYLGDWVDGFWLGKGNALGGETTFDMGSDWSSNQRKPAQGEVAGLSVDSGWLSTARLRALFNCEFHRLLVGDLAGGGDSGLLINGAGSVFDSYRGVEMAKFFGGWCANNNGTGMTLQGKAKHVYFKGMHFLSNGQYSAAGAYNNAYVAPNMTDWGFDGCLFDVNPWFGTRKAGYGLFVDTGCDRYWLRNNSFNAANHYTGGLLNSSAAAANKTIDGNLA